MNMEPPVRREMSLVKYLAYKATLNGFVVWPEFIAADVVYWTVGWIGSDPQS